MQLSPALPVIPFDCRSPGAWYVLISTPMNDTLDLIPDAFRPGRDLLARGCGIDPQTADLVLLQAAGIALGPAVLLRSPAFRRTPGIFDLIIATSEPAAVRFALSLVLLPVTKCIESAIDLLSEGTLEHAQAELDVRLSSRDACGAALREARSRAKEFEAKFQFAGDHPFKLPEDGILEVTDPEVLRQMKEACLPRGYWRDRAAAEDAVRRLEAQYEDFASAVTDVRMLPAPYLIREDLPWDGLGEACEGSFDGFVLHLAGGRFLRQLIGVPRRRLAGYATLLHHFQMGLGATTAGSTRRSLLSHLICCEPGVLEDVAADAMLVRERALAGFLIAGDTGTAASDSEAVIELIKLKPFAETIRQLFAHRLTKDARSLCLDVDGFRELSRFRGWCRDFRRQSPDIGWYFEHWPDLALHLAVLSSALANEHLEGVLPHPRLMAATAFLRAHAPAMAALLSGAMGLRSEAERRADGIERLCRKLEGKPPLTLRQIVRLHDRQDYEAITACVNAAIESGRLERHGDLYSLKAVSAVSAVSASADNAVIEFPQGVGAE